MMRASARARARLWWLDLNFEDSSDKSMSGYARRSEGSDVVGSWHDTIGAMHSAGIPPCYQSWGMQES